MAVDGAARTRRLPWHQSRDGLAVCGSARAAGTAALSGWNALPPIAVGHALSVGLVVALVGLIHASIPYWVLRWIAAAVLIGFGVYRLVRARHPRWVGMRVGFRDLTLWSFLMASAHGAGLMLVPVFLGTMHQENLHDAHAAHGAHLDLLNHPWLAAVAVVVHTLGHLLVAGLVAMVVYEKMGVRILQRAWFNFDLAWAVALVVSGFVTGSCLNAHSGNIGRG